MFSPRYQLLLHSIHFLRISKILELYTMHFQLLAYLPQCHYTVQWEMSGGKVTPAVAQRLSSWLR